MSKYTTGELARLCNVTVRTVQYYDTRGILVPGELTEGGRRLYSDDDFKKLKIICFLRELGLSINSIGQLLSEKDPASVISLLLLQQEEILKDEIAERRQKLEGLELLSKEVKNSENFTLDAICDVACIMENKKKMRKVRCNMLLTGIVMGIVEYGTLALWLILGIWWPFALGMAVVMVLSVLLMKYYYKEVAYICPQCHSVFRPRFKEMFWASHTFKTRKLTCTHCGHKGFCVETHSSQIK